MIRTKTTNINWYVFGAVLLTAGMTMITGHWVWVVLLVLSVYAFGMSTFMVIAVAYGIRNVEELTGKGEDDG